MRPAGEVLAAMARLPLLGLREGFGTAPVLVLAPHPDDESLGCGGMIAEACRQGPPPVVAVLTDGTMSHPGSRRYPAGRLRRLREREAVAATGLLGLAPGRVVFLGYRDTAAPASGPGLAAAAERMARLAAAHGCATIAAPWEHDPHCDHAAAAAIARRACRLAGARLLAYPVWGYALPPGRLLAQDGVRGFRLDVARHLAAKRAAILAHGSQTGGVIDDDPQGFRLEPGFVARFLTGVEVFLEDAR